MLFQRTDKLFERAVAEPEQCERLLKHYRGVRKWASITFVLTFLVVLGYTIWFVVHVFQYLRAITSGHGYPASLDKTLSGFSLVKPILFQAFLWAVASLYTALGADSMTKTLLMVRALRACGAPKTGE